MTHPTEAGNCPECGVPFCQHMKPPTPITQIESTEDTFPHPTEAGPKERLIAAADKAAKKGQNKRNAVGMLLRATMEEIDRLCPPDSETTVSGTEAGERERFQKAEDRLKNLLRAGPYGGMSYDQAVENILAALQHDLALLRTEPGGEAVYIVWSHAGMDGMAFKDEWRAEKYLDEVGRHRGHSMQVARPTTPVEPEEKTHE